MSALNFAIGNVQRIGRAITPELAAAHGLDLSLERLDPIHHAFAPMVREQAYDISEMAIVTGIQAVAFGKPVRLVPVTLAARFQHKCLVHDRRRGSLTPADLPGRRVGVRAYTQTTGAWLRAILQNEYGIHPSAIRWVTQTGAHVAEYSDPPGVTHVGKDRALIDMLQAGEIDAAIFGNDLPDADWLAPVIPDPDAAALAGFERSGHVAINHVICVTQAALDRQPDLPARLIALARAAKRQIFPDGTSPDLFPIGREAMRPSLEALISTVLDQGLVPRAPTVEGLFTG